MENNLIFSSTFKMMDDEEDKDSLIIEGMANAATIDRVGDVIVGEAYEKGGLNNYKMNPIVLFQHNHNEPIGKAIELSYNSEGLRIKAKISKAAGKAYEMIKEGILQTFSIGFRIKDAEYDNVSDILKITDLELFEVSVVSVPANQDSVFSVAKQLADYKENYKKEFTPAVIKKEQKMNEKQIEAMVKLLADKEAELKAAEEIINDAAVAETKRVEVEKEKASAIKVTSQVEGLIKEVEDRFKADNDSISETIKGLEADLKEKADEIASFKSNKFRFEDNSGGADKVSKREKENAVLVAKLLGKDIENTKFYKDLITKSGLEHTPSAAWEEEFNSTVYDEMKDRLVVEPLFSTIMMNNPLMNIPINPEAGDAEWISSNANPNLNLRSSNGLSTGTAVDHKLGETTLQAYKLASKEYIGYEEEEDTIIPLMPMIRDAVTRRMARTSDQSILRGTGAGAGGSAVSPFAGLTTIAATAGTNTTAVAVAAKWTVKDLQSVRRQLGAYGLNPGDVKYVVSQDVYYDLLEDPDFRTMDMVGTNATILSGQIGSVNGSSVVVSDNFASKAATVPCVTAVYTDNFYVGNLRTMMIERDTDVINQKKVIVATRRMGFLDMITNKGVATGVWAV